MRKHWRNSLKYGYFSKAFAIETNPKGWELSAERIYLNVFFFEDYQQFTQGAFPSMSGTAILIGFVSKIV